MTRGAEGERERTILRAPGVEVGPGVLDSQGEAYPEESPSIAYLNGLNGPGTLIRTSVSQITTFDTAQDGGCPTKWWYEKVDGRKSPETASQATGKELHKQIEHYLKSGEDVLGPLARKGRHLLPRPGSDLMVEHEFTPESKVVLSAEGVPFKGAIDVAHVRGEYVDNTGEVQKDPDNTAEVIDHKTTKSISAYAKAGSALIRTVQMPAYGEYLSRLHRGLEWVRFSHNNFQTLGLTKDQREAGQDITEKRTALVSIGLVKDRWKSIEGLVREMKGVALEGDVSKVPKNLNACTAFRGCPHAAYCPRPREAVLASIFGKGNAMGLLDRLKAAKTETPPPAVVAPPQPAVVAPPVVAPPAPVIAALAQEGTLARKKRLAAELAEVERLAALEEAGPDPTPFGVSDAELDADEALTKAILAKEKVVLAKDAKQNATYEGRMDTGEVFRVLFVGRTKAGLTFKRLDKSGGMNLEDDTGLVFVSGPPLSAPVPVGVLPPDAPKPGESGPTFKPFEAGSNAPANVLAEQVRLQAIEGAKAGAKVGGPGSMAEKVGAVVGAVQGLAKPLPVVVTGAGAASTPSPVDVPPVVAGGKRFRRTAEEIAAGLSVEQAQAARLALAVAAPAPKPDEALRDAIVSNTPMVLSSVHEELKKHIPDTTKGFTEEALAKAKAANPIVPAPVDPDAEYEALVTKVDPSRPFTLYLDIAAVKGVPVNDLSKLVDECSGAVAKQYGVIDVRAAGSNSEIGFGKWKGHLHALIAENAPKSGSWSLTGVRESEIRQVAAEALASKASVVFRPVG